MSLVEKTKNKSYLYKGKILNVRKDNVILPDGKDAVREIIEHNGGSAVLCEKDGKILMVRQFRYAYQKELLEIPAGKLNQGEDPKETAIRELEEEGGIKADKMELLVEVYPSPGYTNEIIRIYRAQGLTSTHAHLDEDEFLTAEWIDIEKLREMIKNGEIKDAKTLIALNYVIR